MKTIRFISVWIIVCFSVQSPILSAQTPYENSARKEIRWQTNLQKAFGIAAKSNKPLLVEFMAEWCPSCKAMDDSTFKFSNVIRKVNDFIPVRIDVDKQKSLTVRYKASARKYGGIGIPNILFMDKNGNKIRHRIGYMDAAQFVSVMDSVLTEIRSGR